MQSYFYYNNFSWFSSPNIVYASGPRKKWNIFFSNENDGTSENQHLSFFERFFGRKLGLSKTEAPPPPPPPPLPVTFVEKLWKIVKFEGSWFTKEVIASSAASVASVLVTHPLDTLKAHYLSLPQSRQKGRYLMNGLKLFNEVRKLYRAGGTARFYEGHLMAQRESLFQTVSMFYTEQRVNQMLANGEFGVHPNLCTFVAGFLSATFAVVAIKPFVAYRERQKTKQYLLKRYGPIDAAYVLRRKENFTSLFRGCFPEYMYLGTQYGLRFWLYNLIRDYTLEQKNKSIEEENAKLDPVADLNNFYRIEPVRYLNAAESMVAGAASGIVSDTVSHPLEVISTHLQMGSLQRQQYQFQDTCRHYHQCIWTIFKKHKLRGLYNGFTPTLIKSMICIGLQFTVYDMAMRWLETSFSEIPSDQLEP